MRALTTKLYSAFFVLSVLACTSSSDGTTKSSDVQAAEDVTSTPSDVAGDSIDIQQGLDAADAGAADAEMVGADSTDTADTSCVGQGCPGDVCKSDLDCQSLRCSLHFGEKVCAVPCQSDGDCPDFWTCDLDAAGNEKFCTSRMPHLCLPCRADADCLSNSGTDFCVAYGDEGAFCGGLCANGGECPTGYSCQEKVSLDGVSTSQCVHDDGVCECTVLATDLARLTDCVRDSELGSCEGVRKCTPFGLTKCRADDADQEECNVADDDCDGQLDEGTCDDGDPCTLDFCTDAGTCQNDPQELVGLCGDPEPNPDPLEVSLSAFMGCTNSDPPAEITVASDAKVFAVGGLVVKAAIPEGASKASLKLWGGGGGGCFPGSGGGGGFVTASVSLKAGDELEVRVGTGGVAYGGGGGASYALLNDQVVAVAGGGGGAGCDGCSGCVGNMGTDGAGGAGGAVGGSGQDGTGLSKYGIVVAGAGGGSQSAGGTAGTIDDGSVYGGCAVDGNPGEPDRGADGHSGSQCSVVPNGGVEHCGGKTAATNGGGGGGGAGYFGGGSGGSKYTYVGGGAGGGSSWAYADALEAGGEGGSLSSPGGATDPDYSDMSGQGGAAGDGDAWPGGDWKPKDGHAGRVVWSFE